MYQKAANGLQNFCFCYMLLAEVVIVRVSGKRRIKFLNCKGLFEEFFLIMLFSSGREVEMYICAVLKQFLA